MRIKKLLSIVLIVSVFFSLIVAPTFAATKIKVIRDKKAIPSSQNLIVNGQVVDNIPVYNIDGFNYFKLRDIAYYLDYGVDYFSDIDAMAIWSGGKGDPSGLSQGCATEVTYGAYSNQIQYVKLEGSAGWGDVMRPINIDGSNYFQLRELGGATGFCVDFDSATNTVIVDTDYYYHYQGKKEFMRKPSTWKADDAATLEEDRKDAYAKLKKFREENPPRFEIEYV